MGVPSGNKPPETNFSTTSIDSNQILFFFFYPYDSLTHCSLNRENLIPCGFSNFSRLCEAQGLNKQSYKNGKTWEGTQDGLKHTPRASFTVLHRGHEVVFTVFNLYSVPPYITRSQMYNMHIIPLAGLNDALTLINRCPLV